MNSVCCCLYSKGKNFRANHNQVDKEIELINAVAYIAKVRILEQITTIMMKLWFHLTLLLI